MGSNEGKRVMGHVLYYLNSMSLSNSNSSHSNVFVLSSQSSRNDKSNKKGSYAAFARKVKHLLEAEEDDLDQLYHKIEIIVRKYFDDHKIVEFRDMYDHILALKTNSKRMGLIVNALEKQLLAAQSKPKQTASSDRADKKDEFELTSSTQKDTRSKNQGSTHTNAQSANANFIDSLGTVNTSVKYNHIFKPAFQPEESKVESIEEIPAKKLVQSPLKLNKSLQLHQNRNKQYEEQIRNIMKELESIKKDLSATPRKSSPPQKSEGSMGSQLHLDLRENEVSKSQQTIIDICNEQNFATAVKNSESHMPYLVNKKMDTINQKSKESLNSSHHSIPQTKKPERNEGNLFITPYYEKQSEKSESKVSQLLEYTANITKQIEQLKDAASRLQSDSNHHKPEKERRQSDVESLTSIISQGKINQLIKKASEQKSKKPILDVMEDTTSQVQITEGMIPSFKQLRESDKQDEQVHYIIKNNQAEANLSKQPSQKQLSSSSKNSIHISYHQDSLPSLNNGMYRQPIKVERSHFPQYPQQVQTIKYIVNPYQNTSLVIRPEQQYRQPFIQGSTINNRSVSIDKSRPQAISPNLSGFNSPMTSSSNSSTSIMHPHLFNRPTSSTNINIPSGFRKTSFQNAPMSISIRRSEQTNESIVNPLLLHSNNPVNTSTLSDSSFKRRGLNIVSPPPLTRS